MKQKAIYRMALDDNRTLPSVNEYAVCAIVLLITIVIGAPYPQYPAIDETAQRALYMHYDRILTRA